MNNIIKRIGFYILPFGLLFGAFRGCNMSHNNKVINTSAYSMKSYATGINGHIEYIVYTNGSQDIKEYPGISHRFWDSKLYQDLDGDNLVDRIRQNGAEIKMNKLSELLVREYDYKNNKEKFDKADNLLNKLKGDKK